MAGLLNTPKPQLQAPMRFQHKPRIAHGIRCLCGAPENKKKRETPQVLRIAVSGVTELLRLFSSFNETTRVTKKTRDDFAVSTVDDVVTILKYDYQNAYFVTGIFSSEIYSEDCIFEDPTIRFRGKELYSRNLKLLVPFFESPSIGLQKIEKGDKMTATSVPSVEFVPETSATPCLPSSTEDLLEKLVSTDITSEPNFVVASWKLRTYLNLPWRPLICIDGNTVYELDDEFRIVRHAESWSVSAFEAIGQIFTPSFGRPDE